MKKRVELKVNSMKNLNKMSIVSDPAHELNFQMFSKVEVKKRGEITGVAMRPNKDIPRINKFTGEEYDCFFSEDTVREAAQYFFRDEHQNDNNVEHSLDIDGLTIYESWIINDEKMNNALALGFTDVKKGDWWITGKVWDENLLKEIEEGKMNGFSVEGMFVGAFAAYKEEQEFNKQKVGSEKDNQMLKFIKDNLREDNIELISKVIDEFYFAKTPPLHDNCTCKISEKFGWVLGASESGTCDICYNAARAYNANRKK